MCLWKCGRNVQMNMLHKSLKYHSKTMCTRCTIAIGLLCCYSQHPADGNQLGTELVMEPEAHLTGRTPKEIQERQGGDMLTSQEHKEECKLHKVQLSTIMESPFDMQPVSARLS